MAKIEQGILGGFSGRVGTVVGYFRQGQWCVRAHVPKINDRKSALQLQQRSRFKAMIALSSQLLPALRTGLRGMAGQLCLTEGNCFLKLNHRHFGADTVDYGALQLSQGTLAAPRCGAASLTDGVLEVDFRRSHISQNTSIQLVVFNPKAGRCLVATGRGRMRMLLPDGWQAATLHLYAFAASSLGEASNTIYINNLQPSDQSIESHGGGGGHVERVDAALHRDAGHVVAAAQDAVAQAVALGAEDNGHAVEPPQRGVADGHGAVG